MEKEPKRKFWRGRGRERERAEVKKGLLINVLAGLLSDLPPGGSKWQRSVYFSAEKSVVQFQFPPAGGNISQTILTNTPTVCYFFIVNIFFWFVL